MPLIIDDEGTKKAFQIIARYSDLLYRHGVIMQQDAADVLHELQNLERHIKSDPPSSLTQT